MNSLRACGVAVEGPEREPERPAPKRLVAAPVTIASAACATGRLTIGISTDNKNRFIIFPSLREDLHVNAYAGFRPTYNKASLRLITAGVLHPKIHYLRNRA